MQTEIDTFLTEKEVDELSGIGRGTTEHRGTPLEKRVTKYELQVRQLRTMGIPFFVNARGRPIIARAFFTGAKHHQAPSEPEWEPRLARDLYK